MKNWAFYFILLIGFLFLSSCSSDGSGTKQSGFQLDSFKGGKEALKLSFVEGMPPEAIKDQGFQPFQIRIQAQNLGEYDIPENSAHVKLTGFNPSDLGLSETSKTFPLLRGFRMQGKDEILGVPQTVLFSGLSYKESVHIARTYELRLNANVCYPYETKAVAEFCISGNTIPSFQKDFENCLIEGSKRFSNSGAPVYIENVKQFSNGQNSILIQFDVVHNSVSKLGSVYKSETIDSQCNINGILPSKPEVYEFQNKVNLVIDGGLPNLNCENSGSNQIEVYLNNNRATVTCIQDTSGQGDAYNKLFTVVMDYDYLDRISKTIKVEHVGLN